MLSLKKNSNQKTIIIIWIIIIKYFENLSLLNDNEKKSTKIKSELIRKIFGNEFEKCQNLKKFDILKNKINSSMLKDKFLLVKLISNQIIKEKLINSKKALSKEIIELKKLIDEKNKHINKYKIMEEKLLEIDKNQDKEISKLKDSIKMILKNLNDQKIEFKEEVKLLKKELNESKSSISQLENKLKDYDEKVSQLENKLKDSEETITFMKEKLNYSEKNSEKKITFLNIELGIAYGKQLELVNDIKKLKDCIIKLNEKIDKKEEEYNFMKNLNLQNHQSAITNNGLLRCLNLISKDYELIKSKLDERNEQLENMKKMFKKNK